MRLPDAVSVNRRYAEVKRRLDTNYLRSPNRRALERTACQLRCQQLRIAIQEEKRERRARGSA